jgi:hypothetical protein
VTVSCSGRTSFKSTFLRLGTMSRGRTLLEGAKLRRMLAELILEANRLGKRAERNQVRDKEGMVNDSKSCSWCQFNDRSTRNPRQVQPRLTNLSLSLQPRPITASVFPISKKSFFTSSTRRQERTHSVDVCLKILSVEFDAEVYSSQLQYIVTVIHPDLNVSHPSAERQSMQR